MIVFKTIIIIQSMYMLVTAIWPLVHIDSFMAVTGPKTDIWLVKTVGALLIPAAVSMLMHLFIRTDKRPVIALGALNAVAFMCIDFYYAVNDVISDVYMIDGIIQILFLLGWMYIIFRYQRIVAGKYEK